MTTFGCGRALCDRQCKLSLFDVIRRHHDTCLHLELSVGRSIPFHSIPFHFSPFHSSPFHIRGVRTGGTADSVEATFTTACLWVMDEAHRAALLQDETDPSFACSIAVSRALARSCGKPRRKMPTPKQATSCSASHWTNQHGGLNGVRWCTIQLVRDVHETTPSATCHSTQTVEQFISTTVHKQVKTHPKHTHRAAYIERTRSGYVHFTDRPRGTTHFFSA